MFSRARESASITPDWWDRNCRCCMAPGNDFSRRAMKGAVRIITIMGEEVHDWHTDDELVRFIGALVNSWGATIADAWAPCPHKGDAHDT